MLSARAGPPRRAPSGARRWGWHRPSSLPRHPSLMAAPCSPPPAAAFCDSLLPLLMTVDGCTTPSRGHMWWAAMGGVRVPAGGSAPSCERLCGPSRHPQLLTAHTAPPLPTTSTPHGDGARWVPWWTVCAASFTLPPPACPSGRAAPSRRPDQRRALHAARPAGSPPSQTPSARSLPSPMAADRRPRWQPRAAAAAATPASAVRGRRRRRPTGRPLPPLPSPLGSGGPARAAGCSGWRRLSLWPRRPPSGAVATGQRRTPTGGGGGDPPKPAATVRHNNGVPLPLQP